ncbi:MAG: hypothetical protein IJT34_11390, partial [Butyrivibrio sp.]|nr:hypothetical protein [Butyrivibrio sp.]
IGSLDAVSERSEGARDKDGVKVSKDGVLGYNSSTRQQYLANHKGEAKDYGLEDKFRQPFYTGAKDYKDTTTVRETFDLTRYNFIVGFLGALLFLMILGGAMFTFTSRLFDVIILLIIEPLFIAPMPLDDGEHFQKWMEMFLGKLFSGYGMVVAMNLYLIISARVFDGKLAFFKPGASEMDMFTPLGGGDELMDLLMKTIFLIGGGMAMMSAGPLVTQILSAAAGSEEAAASGAGMSVVGAAERVAGSGVKWAGKKVGGAIGSKLGSVFNGGGNDGEAEGDKDKKSDAAFDGRKSESKKEGATPSTGSNLNKKTGSGVDGRTTNMYDFFGVDKPQSSSGSGGGSGVDGKTTNMYDFFGVDKPQSSSGGGDIVDQAVNNQIGGQNSGRNEGNAFGGSQDGGAGSNNNSGSNKQSTSMYDFFNVPRPDNGGNQDNKDGDNQFNGKK